MTNRWRQSLLNKVNEKKNRLEEKPQEKDGIEYSEMIRKEQRLKDIRQELEDKPLMSEEKFERFERRIESIRVD
jgi:cell division protein FtsX